MGNVVDDQHRNKEFWNKDSPSTRCQRPHRRADEWVQVRETSFPWDGKLSLKADEPQVGQRHEDAKKAIGNTTTFLFSLNGLKEYMMLLPGVKIDTRGNNGP